MVNWLCKIINGLLNDTHKNSLSNVIIGFYFFYDYFKTLYFMKVTIFFAYQKVTNEKGFAFSWGFFARVLLLNILKGMFCVNKNDNK